ncbi:MULTISPECIES: M14-type cytosolic carboxypeptidase [Oceanibaculum]|uniref:Peptidase M14, carboxypeptidase A n=1 Tax=Oceanibaculum indicum P24 TaxID=1207063 RepID=K2JUG7_9PROT|nr:MULTISPECIES: M14-type cytosolic carboxypeptidase [Oceanibaculum]EKE78122.1 peptidase M14, carboxypeptidase A [Oceanibaculum indicum P24]MCH2395396.1 M14-type cytosolic carboxypeptidase [Oceanibaculum sp.]
MIAISSAFDGGNIEVVSIADATARLRIRKDNAADFSQWFYFRVTGTRGRALTLVVENAGQTSYPGGFENYQAVASYDRQDWFRVPTRFDGKIMTIEHVPTSDAVYYAYFAPYSMERHADLVADALTSPLVTLEVPGRTLDGQDIDILEIGEPADGKPALWVIARQHPGETMAEWWVEGFLDRLLDPADAASRALLERAVLYVVPNMNPDGSRRGNLRTNAAGANLNREWKEPSLEKSPEVFHVRQRMIETGIKLCLDVHGDEVLPYNFIAGFEGVPSVMPERLELLEEFKDRYAAINPDFQTVHGYPASAPGKGNLTTSTGYLAEFQGVLAMTLEQPFKDTADTPRPEEGWSPERAMRLGASVIDVLLPMAGKL